MLKICKDLHFSLSNVGPIPSLLKDVDILWMISQQRLLDDIISTSLYEVVKKTASERKPCYAVMSLGSHRFFVRIFQII